MTSLANEQTPGTLTEAGTGYRTPAEPLGRTCEGSGDAGRMLALQYAPMESVTYPSYVLTFSPGTRVK